MARYEKNSRAFIKTFVNRVDYEHPNITVEYTIPFDTKKAEPPDDGVLPTDQNGSPNKSINRTFKISFRFPRKNRSLFLTNEKRHRNPIILAKELNERLGSGEFNSKADIAKSLGYSRARITQLLNLLSLSDQVLEQIRASGDYWVRPLVTERMLRALLVLQEEEQIYEIEKFLRNRRKPEKINGT